MKRNQPSVHVDQGRAAMPNVTHIKDTTTDIDSRLGAGSPVRRRAILVLGMHRSGTSATTRVLNLLGADLPSNLMLPKEGNNEAGFWESMDVYALNDEILASAGSRWDDWRRFNKDWLRSPSYSEFTGRAVQIIEREFAKSSLFVLKDPRICRLVPFWAEVFRVVGAEVNCVLALRNPLEVASSLKARDGFGPAKGHALWLRHVLDAEKATRKLPRVFVEYDALLSDWRSSIKRIGRELRLGWPRKSAPAELEIDRFLDGRHRHHWVGELSIEHRPDVAAWVRDASKALAKLVNDPHATKAQRRLDRIRKEFDRAGEALGAVLVEEEIGRREAEGRAGAFEQQVSELRDQLARRDSRIAELELLPPRIAQFESEVGALSDNLAEREARIAALQQADEERLAEIERLQGALSGREARISELEAQEARQAEQLAALQHEGENRLAEIEGLQGALAQREARIGDLEKVESEQAALIAALNQAAGDARERLESLESTVDQQESQVASLSDLVKERSRDLESIRQQHAALSDEHALLESKVADYLATLEQQQGELLRLNNQDEVTRGELSQLRALLAERESQLTRMHDVAHEREEELTKARKDAAALRGDIARQRTLQTLLSSEVRKFSAQSKQLVHRLNDVQTERQRLTGRFLLVPRRCGTQRLDHSQRRQLRRQASTLIRDNLFDTNWYIEQYPEVVANGHDPMWYWLVQGWRESQDPNPLFDVAWYLTRYQDVAEAGVNPLFHFLRHGGKEGRDPGPFFDTRWYLGRYQDVVAGGINPLVHYLKFGARECRDPSHLFDVDWYLEQAPGAREMGLNAVVHYQQFGIRAGLEPSPLFDRVFYLKQNPDVARVPHADPWIHYLRQGRFQGRSPNPYFDQGWYCDRYPDVTASGMDPLIHYLLHGAGEGMDPSSAFNTSKYLLDNPDVAEARVNPLVHFLKYGQAEGRSPR